MNLELGMKIEGWPPENIDEIRKNLMIPIKIKEKIDET